MASRVEFDSLTYPTKQFHTHYPPEKELPKKKEKSCLEHPLLPVLGSIFGTYILVLIGVVCLIAIELDHRKDVTRRELLEYEQSVALIQNSTSLSVEQKADFVGHLGDAPQLLTDDEYVDQYILFAFSIISTIGYGNISPLMVESRWFCVVYALVGIPLAGILFSTAATSTLKYIQDTIYGDTLVQAFRALDQDHGGSLNKEELRQALKDLEFEVSNEAFESAFSKCDNGDGELAPDEFLALVQKLSLGDKYFEQQKRKSVFLVFVFWGWWIIGGVLFNALEDMALEEALYFSMVTLTTVGLGDYYTTTRLGIIMNIFYSAIGLGIIATCISIGSEYVYLKAQNSIAQEKTLARLNTVGEREVVEVRVRRRCVDVPTWILHLVFTIVALCLLVMIGSSIFFALENNYEVDVLRAEDEFLSSLYRTDNATFVSIIGGPHTPQCVRRTQWYEPLRDDGCKTNWAENRASLFAFTVASTIGYGNHAPITVEGRWFLIFYAFFSIPAAGVCFIAFCSKLMTFWSNIISLFISGYVLKDADELVKKYDSDDSGKLNEEELGQILESLGLPCQKTDDGTLDLKALVKDWDEDGDEEVSVEELKTKVRALQKIIGKALLSSYKLYIAFFAFGAWLLIGGACFHAMEDWDYSTSFYFCVITLTTVGFGDRVPSTHLSSFFLIIWASGGLSVIAILLGSIGDFFKVHLRSAALARLHRLRRKRGGGTRRIWEVVFRKR